MEEAAPEPARDGAAPRRRPNARPGATPQPVFDILAYLVERYLDLGDYPDLDALPRQLAAAGFDPDEIEQAVQWLSGLRQSMPGPLAREVSAPAGPLEPARPASLRFYAPVEQHKITLDGRGYLQFLEANAVLGPAQREVVIERITALEQPEVGLDQVKLIVLLVLWNHGQPLNALVVDELLATERAGPLH